MPDETPPVRVLSVEQGDAQAAAVALTRSALYGDHDAEQLLATYPPGPTAVVHALAGIAAALAAQLAANAAIDPEMLLSALEVARVDHGPTEDRR